MSLNKTMSFICLGVLLVLGQVSSNPDPSMDKMETVMVNEAKPVSNVGDLFKIDDMNLDIGLKNEEAGDEERDEEYIRDENIADEERDEEDFRDEETDDEEIADEEREYKDTTEEETDEEDIVDEDDLINQELWEKSLQSVRSSGQPMTLNQPKERLLQTAFAVKKAIEVMYKCRRPAEKAYKSLKNLKFSLLRRLKKQLTNAKRGQKFGRRIYKALKFIASPRGKIFAAINQVVGCMAKKYGYNAVSVSGEFGAAAGASTALEIGIGWKFGSKFSKPIIFYGTCYGIKSDISIGGAFNIGFWKDLDSIPGESYPGSVGASTGLLTGGVDIGFSLGAVYAKGKNWKWYYPEFAHIGNVYSIGLGAGASPVDIGGHICETTKLYPKENKGWCSCYVRWFKSRLDKNHCKRGYRPKTRYRPAYTCACECKK